MPLGGLEGVADALGIGAGSNMASTSYERPAGSFPQVSETDGSCIS